eukprot:11488534-Ditylum_brightwellii.AAC.1
MDHISPAVFHKAMTYVKSHGAESGMGREKKLVYSSVSLDVCPTLGGYTYVHTSSNGTCPMIKTLMFKRVVNAVGRTILLNHDEMTA